MDRARYYWRGCLELWHGPLGPIIRVTAACIVLLVSGFSMQLTGQLDWGRVYGERVVFVAALGAASWSLWLLGERSPAERISMQATLAYSLLALALSVVADRLTFNLMGALGVHLGLCLQLLVWAAAARKAQKLGLWIMAAAMAAECVNIIVSQIEGIGTVCSTATMSACLNGPFVGVIVPGLMVVALTLLWFNPLLKAFDGRRLEGR